jgi:hypothetical protein
MSFPWGPLQNGKQVQSFLGVVNYFRDQLPNFSRLTSPLDSLRSAGSLEGLWTHEHQEAFNKIKKLIVNAPFLALLICIVSSTSPVMQAVPVSVVYFFKLLIINIVILALLHAVCPVARKITVPRAGNSLDACFFSRNIISFYGVISSRLLLTTWL